jgi:C-terminal processing protease CtpA/Prc
MGIAALDTTSTPAAPWRAHQPRPSASTCPHCSQPRWVSRHGFERVERVDGDVGYIDLRRFEATAAARATAVAAMARLAGASALVLDLSRLRGGETAMAALLTSLLFDTEPLYADALYAPGAEPAASISSEPRCTAQRVTVQVSPETSPLGIAFAANLERLGRATLELVPA